MVDEETGIPKGSSVYSLNANIFVGYGYVTFDSTDPVDEVIERFNDNKINGKWVNKSFILSLKVLG